MEHLEQEGAPAPVSRVRFVASVVVLVAVLGAGLVGGWTAARQSSTGGGGHGHGDGGAEAGHEGHAHGAAAPELSDRTLANLGVETGEATTSDFVRTVDVPAEVEALPLSARPFTSPVAGVLVAMLVAPGQVVRAGEPLAEVLRDAFPQPVLALTEAIIKPLNEDHHEAAVAVRTAALALELAGAELSRLREPGPTATGSERLAGRVVRDAESAERRARLELENARHEAERHGMTEEQIAALAGGGAEIEMPDGPDVRRVLARNRLWSAEADAVLGLLPERLRGSPFALAVLGELVGAARLDGALVRALREAPTLAEHFLDVAGLVQGGATPASLSELARRGALEPLVRLLAPADGPADWDVSAVALRAGTRVAPGDTLVQLSDQREMALRLTPAPSDLGPLAQALAAGLDLGAEPLVRGSGSALSAVRLVSLTGTDALARSANTVVASALDGARVAQRTWALRPGLRFAVQVPVDRLPGRFVLPADAIAYRGAEAVVLMRVGRSFKAVAVRLEHHDAHVAVVAADGALFAGDEIVLRGAPGLALGLLAGAGGADPHAGHSH